MNILTIDTKGFLRLFSGLAGNEDKNFSINLRQCLSEYHGNISANINKDSINLDITCCDISTNGEVIFGTSSGDIFYFDQNVNHKFFLKREQHGSKEMAELVFDCEFITKDSKDMTVPMMFITLSKNWLCIFIKELISFETKFEKKFFLLNNLIDYFRNEHDYIDIISGGSTPCFESFRLLHRLFWIVFWSDSGHLFVFNYRECQIIHKEYFGNTNINSVDFSAEDKFRSDSRSAMIVSTCEKEIHIFKIQRSSQNEEKFIIAESSRILSLPTIPRTVRIAQDMSFLIVGDDNGGLTCKSTNIRPLGKIVWQQKNAHSNWVLDLTISNDQRFILSSSESVKLWNASDGTLLQTFITLGNVCRLFVFFPSFNNGGKQILDNNSLKSIKSNNDKSKPVIIMVTVTDASTLYILRTID